ncbi:MAG TPA: thioredoxin domain-containing protein, partial [Bryobacteraceae bacterium]|nr:thioredoxin domain-containing protein [Bryobacteraceae bacterium]
MKTNRLARQKSPYLLQHAHNPVDWFPWGEEAFRKAAEEDKAIFLSVGYATCHWCHVMERESFEDERIAALLNEHFVPVKVDREERPDVDRIYMLFVQATTGSGGWPMSVWLTPELKPFHGGTYFPPDDRYGRPGFGRVLQHVAQAWKDNRDTIIQQSESVLEELRSRIEADQAGGLLDAGPLESGFYYFRRTFDREHGGFGPAPKFPQPSVLRFLTRQHARTGNPEALGMALGTLCAMARGGIRDHLGGGFHRYSVDDRWFVPHFEKMLYDQAQLAVAYLEAFQLTGDESCATVARGIFEYVLRDMTSPEGGFFSAEDADSAIDPSRPQEKGEGAFYLWERSEIEALLGRAAAEEFCRVYGVEAA